MHRTATGDTWLDALTERNDSKALHAATSAGAVLFMTLLTAAAAQVSFSIPLTPVPFTLQPMVVLMAGLALGPRLGMLSQVLYLAAGGAGLPVFAISAALPPGIARLVGPTGGYLMAYPLAAFVAGALARYGMDRRYLTSFLAMTIGLAVIYTCGVVWLGLVARGIDGSMPPGLSAAVTIGVVPFLAADLVKLCVASGVMPVLWRLRASLTSPTPPGTDSEG